MSSTDPTSTRTKAGNNGCTSTKKCGTCQGDCDSDADCFSGLKCFQRSHSSVLVPGCKKFGITDDGVNDDGHATDYCYKPGASFLVVLPLLGNLCSQRSGLCATDIWTVYLRASCSCCRCYRSGLAELIMFHLVRRSATAH